jgi:hypothetical protein
VNIAGSQRPGVDRAGDVELDSNVIVIIDVIF